MENENDTLKRRLDDAPQDILDIITEFILGVKNGKIDVQKPHIRKSVISIYPLIVTMYAILIITGIISNLSVLFHVIKHRLYKDATYCFIINNVISDIVKCLCVLPITLYVLLVQNWMLGELLCSFLPMVQDIPLHITTLTFVILAWDRLRYIRNPKKPRLPEFVCTFGTWLTALCLVLPYPIYIIYVDLGKYLSSFEGVGICIVNLTNDMQEYMRGIFLIMYVAPLGTIFYLHVKVSRELQTYHNNLSLMLFESRNRETRSRNDSHSTNNEFRSSNGRGDYDGISQYSRASFREREEPCTRYDNNTNDGEIDVIKEKRTQKYLVSMVMVYAVCLCPLMILRVARLALVETYDNTSHFDIVYTIFVWIAFLPTCTTPLLFASWQMSRPAKDRLRGYFRFSNRKLRQSCETVITTTGTPAIPRASTTTNTNNNRRSGDTLITSHHQVLEEGQSDTNSYQQDFSTS